MVEVASIRHHFEREPSLAVVGRRVEPVNPSAFPLTVRTQFNAGEVDIRTPRVPVHFTAADIAFRREALENVRTLRSSVWIRSAHWARLPTIRALFIDSTSQGDPIILRS